MIMMNRHCMYVINCIDYNSLINKLYSTFCYSETLKLFFLIFKSCKYTRVPILECKYVCALILYLKCFLKEKLTNDIINII